VPNSYCRDGLCTCKSHLSATKDNTMCIGVLSVICCMNIIMHALFVKCKRLMKRINVMKASTPDSILQIRDGTPDSI